MFSHSPPPSHRGGTCEGFVLAKAPKEPKETVGREDTRGDEREKGTGNSY